MAQKPPKLDRQTKKNISQVIGKYVDRSNKYMFPAVYAGGGVLSFAALAVDMMGAGGLATVSLHTVSLYSAFTFGGGYVLYSMRTRERAKSNGQKIIASEVVSDALDKMEKRLRNAFTKAAQPNATTADKSALQFVIDDVAQDVQTLSPAFQVVGGNGQQDYLFIVETRQAADGTKEHISLPRKLAEMQKPAPANQDTPQAPVPDRKPNADHGRKKGGFSL